MASFRHIMTDWVKEALEAMDGEGAILDVTKLVWAKHHGEIEESGDFFYTWQYELRWAVDLLRKEGILESAQKCKKGTWKLTKKGENRPANGESPK